VSKTRVSEKANTNIGTMVREERRGEERRGGEGMSARL
jgi:hypothetical protein